MLQNKKEAMLVALASGEGELYTSSQLQKLLFLMDRKIGLEMGGPFYNHQPESYGPFDYSVHPVFNMLKKEGLVLNIFVENKFKLDFCCSVKGYKAGMILMAGLAPKTSRYIYELSIYVRSLGFTQLVSSINKEYPDMAVNAVFQT